MTCGTPPGRSVLFYRVYNKTYMSSNYSYVRRSGFWRIKIEAIWSSWEDPSYYMAHNNYPNAIYLSTILNDESRGVPVSNNTTSAPWNVLFRKFDQLNPGSPRHGLKLDQYVYKLRQSQHHWSWTDVCDLNSTISYRFYALFFRRNQVSGTTTRPTS